MDTGSMSQFAREVVARFRGAFPHYPDPEFRQAHTPATEASICVNSPHYGLPLWLTTQGDRIDVQFRSFCRSFSHIQDCIAFLEQFFAEKVALVYVDRTAGDYEVMIVSKVELPTWENRNDFMRSDSWLGAFHRGCDAQEVLDECGCDLNGAETTEIALRRAGAHLQSCRAGT